EPVDGDRREGIGGGAPTPEPPLPAPDALGARASSPGPDSGGRPAEDGRAPAALPFPEIGGGMRAIGGPPAGPPASTPPSTTIPNSSSDRASSISATSASAHVFVPSFSTVPQNSHAPDAPPCSGAPHVGQWAD